MARSSKLRVMLSSRCNDEFPAGSGVTLSELRRDIKAKIEALQFAGKPAFEVWINEDAPPAPGTDDSWEHCLKEVADCDILIALCNRSAGWAKQGSDTGICHAELSHALSTAPGKVRLIDLGRSATDDPKQEQRNERFDADLQKWSLFHGKAANAEELEAVVIETLHDAVIRLAQAGVRDAAKGKHHSGAALDWTRMDFAQRAGEMKRVLGEALRGQDGATVQGEHLFVKMAGKPVLIKTHAIPAAMSTSAAREMVGQPFLKDHLASDAMDNKRKERGPFHVIACQKSVTEPQAIAFLGFPDAVHVDGPFGRYIADNVQKIQVAFLTHCVDETSTRHAVQRFIEWLKQTNEEALLAERAAARARIVKVIAKEARHA